MRVFVYSVGAALALCLLLVGGRPTTKGTPEVGKPVPSLIQQVEAEIPKAFDLLNNSRCAALKIQDVSNGKNVSVYPMEHANGLFPEVAEARQFADESRMTVMAVAPLERNYVFVSPAFFRYRSWWAATLAHEILHAKYGWDDSTLKRVLCPADRTLATHCISVAIAKGCPTLASPALKAKLRPYWAAARSRR